MKPPLLSQIIPPGSCSIGSTEMEQHKTERDENIHGAGTTTVRGKLAGRSPRAFLEVSIAQSKLFRPGGKAPINSHQQRAVLGSPVLAKPVFHVPTTNSFKYQRSLYLLKRDDVVMMPFSVKDTIVKMLFQRWVG